MRRFISSTRQRVLWGLGLLVGVALVWWFVELLRWRPRHLPAVAAWGRKVALFSPTEPLLAVWYDGQARMKPPSQHLLQMWDTRSQRLLWQARDGGADFVNLAFSPNGKLLAGVSWSPTLVWIRDTHTGQILKTVRLWAEAPHTLQFSPDGRFLMGGGDGFVWTYDLTTGHQHELTLPQFYTFPARRPFPRFSKTTLPPPFLLMMSWDFAPDTHTFFAQAIPNMKHKPLGALNLTKTELWECKLAGPLLRQLPAGRVIAFAPGSRFLALCPGDQ